MTIALIIISTVLMIATLVLLFSKDVRKAQNIYSQKTNNTKIKIEPNNDSKVEELNNEIKRLQLIVKELKSNNKVTVENKEKINIEKNQLEIKRQKQILEQEKELFREKNKKLWDQSMAIHKEKDRIDKLRLEVEARHKEILDSINYAERIQKALVTHDAYLKENLNEYFVFWRPRNIVSGDFYWAKKTTKGFMVVVADSTGHGVPGAFMSLLGISFLNEISAHQPNITPKEILEEIRIKIKQSLQQRDTKFTNKDGMDMVCVSINQDKHELTFAGANNPLWFINNDGLIEYKPVKNPVGIYIREKKFEEEIIKYSQGDIIYMASDGFQDQFGGSQNRKFKKNILKQKLEQYSMQRLSMDNIQSKMEQEFLDWKGKNQQTDDVILMGIRL